MSVPVNDLKSLAEWLANLGLEKLTSDLMTGGLETRWYDHETGEFHSIPRLHWQNAEQVRDAAGRGWPPLRRTGSRSQGYKIFAAQLVGVPAQSDSAQPSSVPVQPNPDVAAQFANVLEQAAKPPKHAGGRPQEVDWLSCSIYLTWYIHDHGYPANQTELVGIIQAWFETKRARIPATSEMYKFARRIFQERDERHSEN